MSLGNLWWVGTPLGMVDCGSADKRLFVYSVYSRPIESLFREMVEEGLLIQSLKVNLSDYIGKVLRDPHKDGAPMVIRGVLCVCYCVCVCICPQSGPNGTQPLLPMGSTQPQESAELLSIQKARILKLNPTEVDAGNLLPSQLNTISGWGES